MSHRTGFVFALAAAAVVCVPWRAANGQRLAPGPQVLNLFSDVGYPPKNYDEKKKCPLVIMLHGERFDGDWKLTAADAGKLGAVAR